MCLQPLAHRVLGIPHGDPKKTDVAVSQEQLDTVDKFKGRAGGQLAASLPCLPAGLRLREAGPSTSPTMLLWPQIRLLAAAAGQLAVPNPTPRVPLLHLQCRVCLQVRRADLLYCGAAAGQHEQAVSRVCSVAVGGTGMHVEAQCCPQAARPARRPAGPPGVQPGTKHLSNCPALASSPTPSSPTCHSHPLPFLFAAGSTTPSCTGQSAAGPATCTSATASALCTASSWASMCRWVQGLLGVKAWVATGRLSGHVDGH